MFAYCRNTLFYNLKPLNDKPLVSKLQANLICSLVNVLVMSETGRVYFHIRPQEMCPVFRYHFSTKILDRFEYFKKSSCSVSFWPLPIIEFVARVSQHVCPSTCFSRTNCSSSRYNAKGKLDFLTARRGFFSVYSPQCRFQSTDCCID